MASESSSASLLIAHIADLHIGSAPNRSSEYRQVFDAFATQIIKQRVDIVVIAGDIFHKKTTFSGSDVADFKYLIAAIPTTIDIIIIPGNHDANLNDHKVLDLISPIVEPLAPNIRWSKYSETFDVKGLTFTHKSVFDFDNKPDPSNPSAVTTANPSTQILLYHGFIAGAVFGKYTVSDKESPITKAVGNSYRAVLAGDIHGMQIFGDKQTIAYPGSMIQQNIGESVSKGYLLWNIPIAGLISPPTFFPLSNDSAMIRLDFRGKSKEEIDQLLLSTPKPNNILKVALYTDSEDSSDQQKMIMDKFGRVDKVNYSASQLITGQIAEDEIEDTLAELLIGAGITLDAAEEIVSGYKERMTIDNRRWYVLSLEFDNMFKYGASNRIDFTKLEGISGVIADNRSGKSSIIDILVYTLFNKLLRGDKNSIINFAKNNARSKLTFVVEPDIYVVEKTIDRSTNPAKVKLSKNGINITSVSIIDTYKTITSLIGTVDQFCATGLFYNDAHNIVTQSPAERMKLMPAIIGIVDEQILVDTKARIKSLKQSISAIPTGNPAAGDILASAITSHSDAIQAVATAETLFSIASECSMHIYSDPQQYITSIAATESELLSLNDELANIIPPASCPLSATPYELSDSEREALKSIIDATELTPKLRTTDSNNLCKRDNCTITMMRSYQRQPSQLFYRRINRLPPIKKN